MCSEPSSSLCLDTDQIKDLHHSSWSPSSADSVFRGRDHLNNMCLCINPPPACAWPWGNCPSIESRAFLPLQLAPAPAAAGALWMLEGRHWFCVNQSWWCRGLWEIINYCVRAAPGADGDLCWQKLCPHKVLRAGSSLCLSHIQDRASWCKQTQQRLQLIWPSVQIPWFSLAIAGLGITTWSWLFWKWSGHNMPW